MNNGNIMQQLFDNSELKRILVLEKSLEDISVFQFKMDEE